MKEKFAKLNRKEECLGGLFRKGEDGVNEIASVSDDKINFIGYGGGVLCGIDSCSGQKAIYPLPPAELGDCVKYVVMDLDGTSIESEEFWIEIIRKTTSELLGKEIAFSKEDIPYVSGHTTAEHIDYALRKYGNGGVYPNATAVYHKVSHAELEKALNGGCEEIKPARGLKEFLIGLKQRDVKVGLVSSGLFYKAIPEIESAFSTMNMGNPKDFYDSIIMGGVEKGRGKYSTMGELVAKPHPWLYKELVVNGLNCTDNREVVVIEDSASGVLSARLAGYAVIGLTTGNIDASGLEELCFARARSLEEAWTKIFPAVKKMA
ncbi:MAG: HAD family hydrolase [Candidatus Scatosoma sp.]